MHFNVYYVFYSLNSHQHVSAVIAVIFRVIFLSFNDQFDVCLQEYKYTFVFV